MYLFITYGRKDMRGVQVRGLRIAKHFSKKEVLFINGGDEKWIKRLGYRYKNYDFNKFHLPSQISLPKKIKGIVFCDLPTNRPFQLGILLHARKKKIPCVVLDNIYHRGQSKETVYQNTERYSDKLILNGLSSLDPGTKKTTVIPPLIDTSLIEGKTKENIKEEIVSNFNLREKPEKIIFAIGYNPSTYKEIIKIYRHFQKEKSNTLFIVISQTKEIKKKKNLVEIPPLEGDKMTFFTKASDLVISRAGYLQTIETLALGRPLVALGEKGGFREKWLDKKITDSVIISESASLALTERIREIVESPAAYNKLTKRIESLHNGELNGAESAAKIIRKTKSRQTKYPKILIVSLDKEKETKEAKELLKKHPFALPIYLSMPFFTDVFERKLSDYGPALEKETLGYNPALIYSLGRDALHSFTKIFPWYEFYLESLKNAIEESDKCFVVGKETYNFLEKIIGKERVKIKVVDKNFPYNIRNK